MNDALVQAQQLRTDSQSQVDRALPVSGRPAQAQAEAIRLEARTEAERFLRTYGNEQQRLLHGNEMAGRQYQAYLASYRQLLERQLQELDALAGETSEAAGDEPARGYRRQA